MKTQLSLFPKSTTEDRLINQANSQTIVVDAYCLACKKTNTVGPHLPIHPIDWMRKNWQEIKPMHFRVSGYCCRQCELSSQNA